MIDWFHVALREQNADKLKPRHRWVRQSKQAAFPSATYSVYKGEYENYRKLLSLQEDVMSQIFCQFEIKSYAILRALSHLLLLLADDGGLITDSSNERRQLFLEPATIMIDPHFTRSAALYLAQVSSIPLR